MASLEEQETIITQNRADDVVSIYTSNTHDIRYFKGRKEFALIEEWFDAETGEIEAASFTLPKDRANIRKIVKRESNMSEEQKQQAAERLKAARNSN